MAASIPLPGGLIPRDTQATHANLIDIFSLELTPDYLLIVPQRSASVLQHECLYTIVHAFIRPSKYLTQLAKVDENQRPVYNTLWKTRVPS